LTLFEKLKTKSGKEISTMKKIGLALFCSCFLMLELFSVGYAFADTSELKMSHFMPTKHVQHSK